MTSALIAEDEPLLRLRLRESLLALWPELEIVAEVDNGLKALHAVEAEKPDVLFLDIRMPGMSGLDVARQLSGKCHIVFITAFDEYAVAAFEEGVVDYVLKPFEIARLATTVARVKARIGRKPADLRATLDQIATASEAQQNGYLRWIQASVGVNLRFITTQEIIYFQSDAKYTRVITEGTEALIRKPVKDLIEQLDPSVFWQIHRGTIINISYIDAVIPFPFH